MKIYAYIIIMALTIYTVRVLPLTLITKPIKSKFIRSFLYYVPYVTLSIMTFPAIIEATNQPIAGMLALIIGMILAWKDMGLLKVSMICCLVVLIVERLL